MYVLFSGGALVYYQGGITPPVLILLPSPWRSAYKGKNDSP